MKRITGDRGGRILQGTACAVLLVLLITLTLYMVYILNLGWNQPDFDFEEITSDGSPYAYDADLSRWFLPEFIGIFSGGEKRGLSGAATTTAGIYKALSPALSALICPENLVPAEDYSASDGTDGASAASDDDLWDSLSGAECGVYLRYHSEVPDVIIGIFADDYYKSADADRFEVEGGEKERRDVGAYVYEMYLIPPSPDADSAYAEAVVRSWDGVVRTYRGSVAGEFTVEYVAALLSQYRRNMYAYEMKENEPVFTQSVAARKILMTDGTAAMIQNASDDEIKSILGFFGLNTEKLLFENVDDGQGSYGDINGIFTAGVTSFEFTSASDGGIGVDDFIGRSDSTGLREYIEASVNIINYFRTLNRNYAGMDAEFCFDSVEVSGGVVTVKFFYAFDNIRITGIDPAFTAVFENGILRSARLYTLAVRNLGVRQIMMDEGKFIRYVGGEFRNTTLVYRCDFFSESVRADWMGRR